MNRSRRPHLTPIVLAVVASALVTVVSPRASHADPLICKRALSSASAKYTRSVTIALQKCEDARVSGAIPAGTDCSTNGTVTNVITHAQTKLTNKLASSCGGQDHTCGTGDDENLVSIGWGNIGTCPGLKGASCSNAISNCADIATCLACVGRSAASQTVALDYGSLNSAEFGTNSPTNLCQRSLGGAASKFFLDRLKAVQKCWDARLLKKHSNACPDPGDGKATIRIAHADQGKQSRICRACGGPDHQCGGGDDLATSQVGFASQCSDVTSPSDNASCSGTVSDMSGAVTCVDCDATYLSDCVAAIAVSSFLPYPQECSPNTPPNICPQPLAPADIGEIKFTSGTGSTSCGSGGFSTPADPPFSGELDDVNGNKLADLGLGCLYEGGGRASLVGGNPLPDGFSTYVAVTGTTGTVLTVGPADGTGPADCTRGAGPGRHCVNSSAAPACTSDADCGNTINACALDANCFFGPPTPVPGPVPALSVCSINEVLKDVCGQVDLSNNGSESLNIDTFARVYITGDAASPCPVCQSGTCSAGERQGLPCTGVGSLGTTVDCPPRANAFIGNIHVNLVVSSGTATLVAPNGAFCPAQRSSGAFGVLSAHTITETASGLTPAGVGAFTTSIGAVTCIPPTGNGTFDTGGDLPGPAAISETGTITVTAQFLLNLQNLLCTTLGMCSTLCQISPIFC